MPTLHLRWRGSSQLRELTFLEKMWYDLQDHHQPMDHYATRNHLSRSPDPWCSPSRSLFSRETELTTSRNTGGCTFSMSLWWLTLSRLPIVITRHLRRSTIWRITMSTIWFRSYSPTLINLCTDWGSSKSRNNSNSRSFSNSRSSNKRFHKNLSQANRVITLFIRSWAPKIELINERSIWDGQQLRSKESSL